MWCWRFNSFLSRKSEKCACRLSMHPCTLGTSIEKNLPRYTHFRNWIDPPPPFEEKGKNEKIYKIWPKDYDRFHSFVILKENPSAFQCFPAYIPAKDIQKLLYSEKKVIWNPISKISKKYQWWINLIGESCHVN